MAPTAKSAEDAKATQKISSDIKILRNRFSFYGPLLFNIATEAFVQRPV